MQDLGAEERGLCRVGVAQRGERAGRRNLTRIRRQHAIDVGPDLDPFRTERCAENGGGSVRAAAAEQYGPSAAIGTEETRDDRDAAPSHDASRGLGREVEIDLALAEGRVGAQDLARIDALDGEAESGEPGRHHRCGKPLAQAHRLVVELVRAPPQESDGIEELLQPLQALRAVRFGVPRVRPVGDTGQVESRALPQRAHDATIPGVSFGCMDEGPGNLIGDP